jgi:hypothetical protein
MNITSSLTQHCHARTGASFWPRPYPGESHEHFAVRISRRYRDTPEAFLLHRIDWQIMGHNTFRSAKIAIGFLLRVWATFHFYEQHMKVISLVLQKKLITSGPYRFSRNPLYLGGNVFIFFAADLFLGSITGIFLTVVNILFVEIWIRREEKQLERDFGGEWARYKSQVRRWF